MPTGDAGWLHLPLSLVASFQPPTSPCIAPSTPLPHPFLFLSLPPLFSLSASFSLPSLFPFPSIFPPPPPFPIPPPLSFEIDCDTTAMSLYKTAGYVNEIKQPSTLAFKVDQLIKFIYLILFVI